MEREILLRFKSAREAVRLADETAKAARQSEREAEQALIDYLEAKQASATGRYDGLGWAAIGKPTLYASANAEVLPQVFAWLRAHGQESAIKETIHHSTLSQIVSEQLRDGGEVPPGVSYYLRPNVRIYNGN